MGQGGCGTLQVSDPSWFQPQPSGLCFSIIIILPLPGVPVFYVTLSFAIDTVMSCSYLIAIQQRHPFRISESRLLDSFFLNKGCIYLDICPLSNLPNCWLPLTYLDCAIHLFDFLTLVRALSKKFMSSFGCMEWQNFMIGNKLLI